MEVDNCTSFSFPMVQKVAVGNKSSVKSSIKNSIVQLLLKVLYQNLDKGVSF